MKKILTLSFLLIQVVLFGQKKLVDHTVYDSWKSIGSYQISDNGKFVIYERKPQKGNSNLFVYDIEKKDTLRSISRGTSPVFIGNDHFLYTEKFDFDSLRKLKLAKTKKSKLPKNNIVIRSVKKGDTIYRGIHKSFQTSEENEVVAWISEKLEKDKCCVGKKKCKCKKKKKKKKKKGEPEIKENGTTLFYITFEKDSIPEINKVQYVKSYELSDDGSSLSYVKAKEVDTTKEERVFIIDLKTNETSEVFGPVVSVKKIRFSEHAKLLSILSSIDTNKADKVYDLALWNKTNNETNYIVDHKKLDSTLSVSALRRFYFSENETRLFYGIGKRPVQKEDDTLLVSEKAKLDLWSWHDDELQPMQLKRLNRDKNKSNLHVYDVASGRHTQLENDSLRWSYGLNKNNGEFGIASNSFPYKRSYSWEMPWPTDMYLVDVKTGKPQLIKKETKHGVTISPNAKHIVWYNSLDSNYYSINNESKKEVCLTKDMNKTFTSDNNGMPFEAYGTGISGWDPSQEYIFLQTNFDVWKINVNGTEKPLNLTKNGEKDSIKYSMRKFDFDSLFIDYSNIYFKSHDMKNHHEFVYLFDGNELSEIDGGDVKLYDLRKPKNSNNLITRWGSVSQYPDLMFNDVKTNEKNKISNINAQQEEYNWATVESFFWTTPSGKELEGLIYKPEDFDATKSYPLMVYFYEMYSTRKNVYYGPRPSASIINPLEYASNGYVVFIPDIRYEIGYPAKSAYDCIVSGTDSLTKKFSWIDSKRMALQGQSWGGYQTAQLVTMTDKYACAMAGAPVSNMFSAYGGMRWGSGMSRMFQYERTQSRIGATIWEKPELYRENSPVFGLPNVKTPLLIMHNDGDGAVPWYQGIEMFVGLRRLNKPVWMLNYNGDEHNLMKRANRMDLSRRMRGFFDHYLLGKPAPKWLKDGIPAVDKGEKNGFELISE